MTLISPQKSKFARGPFLLIGLNVFIVVLPKKTPQIVPHVLSTTIDFNSLQAIAYRSAMALLVVQMHPL